VEHLDAVFVFVDEGQIVELLEQEAARIVEDIATRMISDPLEQNFEGNTVVDALARMPVLRHRFTSRKSEMPQ